MSISFHNCSLSDAIFLLMFLVFATRRVVDENPGTVVTRTGSFNDWVMNRSMGKLFSITGWLCIVFGFFTLGAVLTRNYDGWITSLLMLATGWSVLHYRRARAEGDLPAALRPLHHVLGVHLVGLIAWAAGIGLRLSEWGTLPTPAFMNSALCLAMGLSLLAALELTNRGKRHVVVLFGLLALTGTKLLLPGVFVLPSQYSSAVGMGIVAALVVYILLLVSRRWVT